MIEFDRNWIIEQGISIVKSYDVSITIRALHYRLVSIGMPNTMNQYKKVIAAMTKARWDGEVRFDAFVDHERSQIGETKANETILADQVKEGKSAVKNWVNLYFKNRWENQPIYPEVWIEKKALISHFERACARNMVSLCPCKGYPSLTFLNQAFNRFVSQESMGKELVILYFGDYDPSGEDIPRSLKDNLLRLGVHVDVRRILLLEDQVIEMRLPPAPTKESDTRSRTWNGIGQVELDAIELSELENIAENAIQAIFDHNLHRDLLEDEKEEKVEYKKQLKSFVKTL